MAKSGGKQRASETIAQDIGVLLAGRLLDGVERRQRALEHVIDEVLCGMALVRVDP